ncbi:ribonucleotide-diphosphate reductase subunit beta [Halobacillus halophilus]|uniref:Ribonucleoside-diphosphate reductase subunit beta n=1 Tax=Halobacillus halophilus (strain ATCC 35676 / DSM 2266 / JCM 20832 / KCTC 3685 / LMG 17431 / NBRC 102448 / NCIMB 2269) TaxID=866895 RepID=I0JHS7_HALH3|nr:ribonucleotide-diphosphate reductase subunit beta [Halobacillus halophilus]ASF37899.1 ribonucleotide-diphosphate reductase subunit beta [Halobacillus halophilus]CCG43695.1 ribonucleotide-diphosphate reductase beta subunit [Halobacillus halophilus DSM 2266]
MNETIQKRKLVDHQAPNVSTGIINGRSSNVLNWDDTRYSWAYPMYKNMLANFWIPNEINMSNDLKQWGTLSDQEQATFKKIIGLLAFLDSIQTDYSGKIADYLTDSSLSALMQVLAFQEVVHNQSYSYVLSTLVDQGEQEEIFEYWKHDDVLIERNQFITDGYQAFADDPSVETFLKSIVYDVVLEGLFFYAGFAFFYNLARNNKMVSTSTMINYINRDEQIHVSLFCRIFNETLNENPQLDEEKYRQFVKSTFEEAVELEIKWAHHIIGDRFPGIPIGDLEDYIRFMANKRCRLLGAEKPFPEYNENPLKWIKAYQEVDEGKSDFFEQKSRQYTKVSETNGFDEL